MIKSSVTPGRIEAMAPDPSPAAIVVHAFYPDVFEEVLARIRPLPRHHKLFVSTVSDHHSSLRHTLEESGRAYVLRVVENRGRDVLPFLKLYPQLRSEGFERVVKIHTKKTAHRKDGAKWRADIFEKLLDSAFVESALQALNADPTLGMIGPAGHYVPVEPYLTANRERVLQIGSTLGMRESDILSGGFFAGTMFIARTSALDPLMGLGFTDEDFEPEAGQKDGTLAHAFERAFAFSVQAGGYWLASSANLDAPATVQPKYSFAKRRRRAPGILGELGERLRAFERTARHVVRRKPTEER